MNVFRAWCTLLMMCWTRVVAGFLFVLAMFFVFPGTRAAAGHLATGGPYFGGLVARLSDPTLWKRSLLFAVASGLCLTILMPAELYLSLHLRKRDREIRPPAR